MTMCHINTIELCMFWNPYSPWIPLAINKQTQAKKIWLPFFCQILIHYCHSWGTKLRTKSCNRHPTRRPVHRILHTGDCLTSYQPHFSDTIEEVSLHSSLLILNLEHTAWDAEITKGCSSNHKIKDNTVKALGISRYKSTDNFYLQLHSWLNNFFPCVQYLINVQATYCCLS